MRQDPSAFDVPADLWDRPAMREALERRDIGAVLRLMRQYAGASQMGLSMRIGIAQPEISGIMTGRKRVTSLERLERVADGLDMPDEARMTLGLAPHGWSLAAPVERLISPADRQEQLPPELGLSYAYSLDQGIQSVTDLWSGDVQRREVLVDAVFAATAFTGPAIRWLTGGSDDAGLVRGSRRVGQAEVETIREMTSAFRRLDNRFGGGHARDAVVRFLHHEVAPLLRDGSYRDATGNQLFSATSELTLLAAWMAYDTDRHGLAQRYLIQALRLAKAGQDRPLGAEILAGMSHQALYLDQASEAVDLARAARETAAKTSLPTLSAESAVMEAHAHARRGDASACTAALRDAEQAMDKPAGGEVPSWLTYLDEAYLAAKFGHCFRELGQPEQAAQFAQRSLDMDGRYVRGRAFNLTLLASAYVQQGEIEQACEQGHQALDLVDGLHSSRGAKYLRDLGDQLQPYGRVPVVRELAERSAVVLGPARS
jgi:transcriptional regulator with XRE-family HTH domain